MAQNERKPDLSKPIRCLMVENESAREKVVNSTDFPQNSIMHFAETAIQKNR